MTRTFSILSAALIFGACYVDVYEIKSSSSAYSSEAYSATYSSSSSLEIDKKLDSLRYQDQSYAIIKIGSLIWMAQNLNAEPSSGKGHWWCAGDPDEQQHIMENCRMYGKFYDWEAAMNACPTSWRLPSYDDFKYLSDYLIDDVGLLKSPAWWNGSFNGYRNENTGDYMEFSINGYWWSSTDAGGNLAYYSYLQQGSKLYYNLTWNKARAYSVRCVQDFH